MIARTNITRMACRASRLLAVRPRFLAVSAPRHADFIQVQTFSVIKTESDDSVVAPPMGIPDTLRVKLSSADTDVIAGRNLAVTEVIIPTVGGGTIGVLPGHEYSVQRMDAGVIIVKTATQSFRFATAGGFAHVNDNGSVDINTIACFPLEDIDLNLVRAELDAARSAASSSDPVARAAAPQGIKLYEAILAAN